MTGKVDIVISAKTTSDLLRRTLEALEPQRGHISRVLVIDNNNEEPLEVADWAEHHTIESPSGAFAKNYGIKQCTSDLILMMDSTIMLPDGTIAAMLRWRSTLIENGYANPLITAPTIFLEEECEAEDLADLLQSPEAIKTYDTANNACLYHDHCCALNSASAYRELGGYDAEYYTSWGFENHDYNMRHKKAFGCSPYSLIPRDDPPKPAVVFHNPHPGSRPTAEALEHFQKRWGLLSAIEW